MFSSPTDTLARKAIQALSRHVAALHDQVVRLLERVDYLEQQQDEADEGCSP